MRIPGTYPFDDSFMSIDRPVRVPMRLDGRDRDFPSVRAAYYAVLEPERAKTLEKLAADAVENSMLGYYGFREDAHDDGDRMAAMRRACYEYYTSNEHARQQLLTTLSFYRVARLRYPDDDPFWGIGKDGTGHDMLGTLLTELRSALTNAFKPGQTVYGRIDGRPMALYVNGLSWKDYPSGKEALSYVCSAVGGRSGMLVMVKESDLSMPQGYAKWPMRVELNGILPAAFLDARPVFAMAPPDMHHHVVLSQCDDVDGHGPYAYVHAGNVRWPR